MALNNLLKKKGTPGKSYLLFTSSRFSSSSQNVLDFRGVREESNRVRRITQRNAQRLEAVRAYTNPSFDHAGNPLRLLPYVITCTYFWKTY